MNRFKGGVSYYTTGTASIRVHFPEDCVTCQYCPFCRPDSDLRRYWCRLMDEMVYNPFVGVMDFCPIELQEVQDGKS